MHLNVRTKLLGVSAILIAFMVAIGLLSIVNLGTANDNSVKLTEKVATPLADMGVARAKFNENRAFLNNYMLETDSTLDQGILDKITANDALITEKLAAIKATLLTDEGKAVFAELEGALAAYTAARTKVENLADTATQAEAYALNKAEAVPAAATAAADFQKLFDMKVAIGDTTAAEVKASYESSRMITIAALLLAALIGFALSFYVSGGIVKGLRKVQDTLSMLSDKDATWLAEGMEKLRDNDLTYAITPATALIEKYGTDEIGQTAEYTNSMRNRIVAAVEAYNDARAGLSGTITEVQEAADSVSRTSEQLNEAATQSGAATQQVATTISQVAGGTAE
ncbi:MAG: methyl-accepting chemotaxis protein, partial [Chloroflexota bacterium]